MNAKELKEVLRLHFEWLQNNGKGKKANLQYADLQNAILYISNRKVVPV